MKAKLYALILLFSCSFLIASDDATPNWEKPWYTKLAAAPLRLAYKHPYLISSAPSIFLLTSPELNHKNIIAVYLLVGTFWYGASKAIEAGTQKLMESFDSLPLNY